MHDIVSHGDKYKRIIKIAEGWLRKKLGASIDVVHKDMQVCGNPVFSEVAALINEGAGKVNSGYQSRIIKNYGELFLWILYKDTAYRDVAIWLIYQMLDNADELKAKLQPYLRNPEDWYVNAWTESKKHTEQLRKEGKIAKNKKSLDEYIFTPPVQEKMLKKYK